MRLLSILLVMLEMMMNKGLEESENIELFLINWDALRLGLVGWLAVKTRNN